MSRPNTTEKTIVAKLMAKRNIVNECWEFIGSRTNTGYGTIRYMNKLWLAHRLSLKIFKPEEYKPELQVNHKCSNRKCFNPDHLYAGNQVDNMKDLKEARASGKTKPYGNKILTTHCPNGHISSSENTTFNIRNGIIADRKCRICHERF